MASRYWVGGTGNWDAATTTNWSTSSGGGGGASVPTSSDDVIFDTLSNATAYTVTVTATANCANISFTNPLSGALTFAGSSALNVFGNFTILSTITRTYTGAITFSAVATGKTITFNGITMASTTTFNGVGGGWTLQDNWNNGTSIIGITNGAIDTNGKTVTCGTFQTSTGVKSITLGASTINAQSWQINSADGLTMSAASSTINMTAANATFRGYLNRVWFANFSYGNGLNLQGGWINVGITGKKTPFVKPNFYRNSW